MPRYEHPQEPRPAREPFVIRSADGREAFAVQQNGEQQLVPYRPYEPQPGARLEAGHDGRPAYIYAQAPQEPARPVAHPWLVNAALGTVVAIGVGVALWFASAFVAALASLIQALAMILAVLVGGAVALKILGGGRRRVDVDVEAVSGRGRRKVRTRTRVRG